MKSLFIMAGYRGAGKSSLLVEALSRGIPLFGSELDPVFRSTKLPSRLPEWSLTAEQLLEEGAWFSTRHVPFLATLESLPDNVVIHVDLVSVVSSRDAYYGPGDPSAVEARRIVPRSMRDLAEETRNRALFELFLSSALFRRFDRIAVNTLYVPWETASAQWHGARTPRGAAQKKMAAVLFGPDHAGPAIHQSIYNGWLSAIRAADPELSLLSEFRDGRLVIAPLGGREPASPPR